MSLDVYLTNGDDGQEVFWRNITHNLTKMAGQAGVYEALWRPDEIGITKAKQLIEPLKAGFAALIDDPEKFKKYEPKNKWGSYEGLRSFVASYLCACVDYPEADVKVCR